MTGSRAGTCCRRCCWGEWRTYRWGPLLGLPPVAPWECPALALAPSYSCCRKVSGRCPCPNLLGPLLPLLRLLLLPSPAAAAPCADRPAGEPSVYGCRPLPRSGRRAGERREVREGGWAGGGAAGGFPLDATSVASAAPFESKSQMWHWCIDEFCKYCCILSNGQFNTPQLPPPHACQRPCRA